VSALQFNLCNSGIAPCFTGRSVSTAAGVIRDERPTIVTLNEVCENDLPALEQAMPVTGGARVVSAFKAARDRDTHESIRCLNGARYGIGVLASIPASVSTPQVYGGIYSTQDLADPEERVWACIDVPTAYFACTTHAADGDTTVTLAQCRYFLSSAVPIIRAHDPGVPVILGADLNLPAGGRPSPESCVPPGYVRADDGARQDVVTSPEFAVLSRTVIDMHGTTDHPGLFVVLTRASS
jgi:hypothetical protein